MKQKNIMTKKNHYNKVKTIQQIYEKDKTNRN